MAKAEVWNIGDTAGVSVSGKGGSVALFADDATGQVGICLYDSDSPNLPAAAIGNNTHPGGSGAVVQVPGPDGTAAGVRMIDFRKLVSLAAKLGEIDAR